MTSEFDSDILQGGICFVFLPTMVKRLAQLPRLALWP